MIKSNCIFISSPQDSDDSGEVSHLEDVQRVADGEVSLHGERNNREHGRIRSSETRSNTCVRTTFKKNAQNRAHWNSSQCRSTGFKRKLLSLPRIDPSFSFFWISELIDTPHARICIWSSCLSMQASKPTLTHSILPFLSACNLSCTKHKV